MDSIYENAARLYCAARGLDPDERVGRPHPEGYAVVQKIWRWAAVAEELRDMDLRRECLEQARATLAPEPRP